jgi:hypothetical protein
VNSYVIIYSQLIKETKMKDNGQHFTVEEWAAHCVNTHTNPYRDSDSHELFDFIKGRQIVTKDECREWMQEHMLKDESAAAKAVDTMFSPRESSNRGDPRGRVSAQGHIYYMEKLGRQVRMGVRDPQSFRLRWRKVALSRKIRNSQLVHIEQEKTKPVSLKTVKRQLKEKEKESRAQKKLIAHLIKLSGMEVEKT